MDPTRFACRMGTVLSLVACGGSKAEVNTHTFDIDAAAGEVMGQASDVDAGVVFLGVDPDAPERVSGSGTACATAFSSGNLDPVSLVFMYDSSSSMDYLVGNRSKWAICKDAFTAFFGDPNSAGVSSSLTFFSGYRCGASDFVNPEVSMRQLPNDTAFGDAITKTRTTNGTPTLPALQGALGQAQAYRTSNPGRRVAVVLVTDGMPTTCDKSIQHIAEAAALVHETIPTYVIGLGSSNSNDVGWGSNLQTIARGGGTAPALIISANEPEEMKASFQQALTSIRGRAVQCSFDLPTAPSGRTLEPRNASARFVEVNGTSTPLAYNAACSGGDGWRYDAPQVPKKVELCPGTCAFARENAAGHVELAMGCTDNSGVR